MIKGYEKRITKARDNTENKTHCFVDKRRFDNPHEALEAVALHNSKVKEKR